MVKFYEAEFPPRKTNDFPKKGVQYDCTHTLCTEPHGLYARRQPAHRAVRVAVGQEEQRFHSS